MVAHVNDIPDADKLFENLSDAKSDVKLFYVRQNEIEDISKLVPSDLRSYRGTMLVHQVIYL